MKERVAALSFNNDHGQVAHMSKITEKVSELAEPIVKEAGCTLWDVEYVREAGTYYLRLYIDKEGGVSINDCEAVSRALDPVLDEADPVPDSYVFEVSSPGAERELKRPSDFALFMGSDIELKTYKPLDGQKTFIGKLSAYNDGDVTITIGNTDRTVARADVAKVRLHVSF